MYEDRYGKGEDLLAGTAPMPALDKNAAAGSSNGLKLYLPRPFSETPIRRFATLGPTQDTHPWMAKDIMKECGIGQGDLETASLRKTAAHTAAAADDTSEEDVDEETLLSSVILANLPRRNERPVRVSKVQKVVRRVVRQSDGREVKATKRRHG